MKKYTILTSLLALAACGGGHHDYYVAPSSARKPAVAASQKASDFTSMGTSVTNQTKTNAAKEDVVKYVGDIYGEDIYAAAKPETQDDSEPVIDEKDPELTLDEKYDIAMGYVKDAKELLSELTAEGITDENLDDVISALKLAGQTIENDADVDAIKGMFTAAEGEELVDFTAELEKVTNDWDKKFTEATQKLDDVIFDVVDNEDGFMDGKDDRADIKYSFTTDGENIVSATMYDGEKDTEMTALGNNKFKGVEIASTFKMFGKGAGLEYSDFGTNVFSGENDRGVEYLAGGYDVMKIAEMPDDANMTFKGTAIASAFDSENPESAMHGLMDEKATLTFADGASKLNMSFANWYDVEIANNTATFSKEGKENFAGIEFAGNGTATLNANFYGDGSATESTALFGYKEIVKNTNADDETEAQSEAPFKTFVGAFGGKLDVKPEAPEVAE